MAFKLDVGLVLPLLEAPTTGEAPRWESIEAMAGDAETIGFNTVWIPDELLWRVPTWPGPRGWWECVAIAGAVAASTTSVSVGTWVLSTLHRNPGLTAKIATTLDEISAGRFMLGLGAGHAGDQGATFGFPDNKVVSRYEEALHVIVPALRGETVTFEGEFHRSRNLENLPRPPQPRIPLMLGGHGPRTMRLAARHGDIWSAYATETSQPEWFAPMIERLNQACTDVGRDPATLGRSIGVFVELGDEPQAEAIGLGVPISGSPQQIAETLARFAEIGATRIELVLWPNTPASLEAFAPVAELLQA